jgi:DNA repair exonuclease SbcCD ATPase subunit
MSAIAQAAPADASDQSSGASLDKVRDILFGVQMREYERRLTRLEERLAKETTELKEDVRKRLEALDSYVKRENESLAERLSAERAERTDSHKGLARDLQDAHSAFERRTGQIDEQLAKSQRDLRQQILDQHQRLSDEIQQRIADVLAVLTREAQELRTEKADRATLASLLTEMALRLTNELRIPGAGDVGNA